MGKRKERRLAALSNAGRRVKLDLFAEPSGELGGSNVQGDAGGDTDSQHHDGLPNSPSSSGQPQNPLLLLGQYSDDEVDDGSSKEPGDAKVQSPMSNEVAKDSIEERSKDCNISVSVDHASQNDEHQSKMENSTSIDPEGGEENASSGVAGNFPREVVSNEQMCASRSFDEQLGTDINLGWKMVIHEESQRYYYWNVETGETSWEVPQVLVQAAQLSNNSMLPSIDDKPVSGAVGIDNSSVPSSVMQDTLATFTHGSSAETIVTSHNDLYGYGSQLNGFIGEHTNVTQGCDVSGKVMIGNNGIMSFSYGGDPSFVSNYSAEEQQSQIDLPSHLEKQSEILLERLKSLKEERGNLQGQDTLSKYMLEIEIRLSDIKSLASYGSSLLPFWVHSDNQIKLIESVINNLQTVESAKVEAEDKNFPDSEAVGEQQNVMGHDSEVYNNNYKDGPLTSEVSNGPQADASPVVLKDTYDEIPTSSQHFSSNVSDNHLETGIEVRTEVQANTNPEQSTLGHGCNVEDDVDMDVDMEVEDMNSSGNLTGANASVAKDPGQIVHEVQLNPLADSNSLLPEHQFVVPPPPDDEWIPPPPPDNEQAPLPPLPPDDEQVPPPPGDPQPPAYHPLPSYAETGQSLSYAQYSLSYGQTGQLLSYTPVAGNEYYGQAAPEIPTSNIYGQIAMPPGQLYYSAVPNLYSENPQVVVNPSEPVSYFESQEGAGSTNIPVNNFSDSCVGGAGRESGDVPSTSSSMTAPATVSSVDESASLPSTTAETAAGSAASSVVAKTQTKVVRKKRAVAVGSSLKSNKKVSSLVDKWKAAKEELLEEEEEPESVYEVFERKRQREIEEWHAKQIASGEAKDNANFQPLGGDWRERVKRKRAQRERESVETRHNDVEHGQQQPDLTELSKGLPSNWQVYYGNTITSETTWTRPTK
ncbi:hypothetical protein PIB30_079259 [Stylosanthes scabra]|uniref:WW domain-containing protein n=2 Tax=Stylosanthes scabra TaxID=79078 RepID=A0ABU6YRP0_9FABA|nr:hypothetical protein [Stylosanthes scabra]